MDRFILSAFADEIDTDLKKQMDVLKQHGIRYIEMRGVNGKNLVEYSLNEVREIKQKLDERGFKISAIGSPIGKIQITEKFEAHLDLFKHTLDIAEILETKYIRMFSFFIPKGEDPAMYRTEVMNRWHEFINAAKGREIILLHENEKDIYGDTPERCLDILNTMNCDFLKATFDPANFVQCDVEVYPKAFTLLKEYIEYVHIKDAVYSDYHVTPAGSGDGRVKEILEELNKIHFKGFVCIEPHLGDFQGFRELELNSNESSDNSEHGERKFAVAVKALKDIILEIGRENC